MCKFFNINPGRDDYNVAMGVSPWKELSKQSSSIGAADSVSFSRSYGAGGKCVPQTTG